MNHRSSHIPIDPADMDTSTSSVADFYQYANGGWMRTHPLRDEFSRYGTFDQLDEENEGLLKNMMEELSNKRKQLSGNARKIGDFYQAGIDEASINRSGLEPLQELLGKIDACNGTDEVQALIAEFHSCFISILFGFYATPDYKNSGMMIAHLSQGGLGLPDRDYYLDTDERSLTIRQEYQKHIGRVFSLAGLKLVDSRSFSDCIMEIETRLARVSMTKLELRDPYNSYHLENLAGLESLAPGLGWKKYFSLIGLPDPGNLNIAQPLFFKEFGQMCTELPIEDWKCYLQWSLLNASAPYLSEPFVQEHFGFYGRFMSGKKELKPRWKRVIGASDMVMGEAIGEIYVNRYFPPEAKSRMLELVDHLKEALRVRILGLEWMAAETKERALEKLGKMRVKIGYPDKWRNFEGLQVTDSSYFTNMLKGSAFEFAYELSKVNKPVDLTEWEMTPQTVNAYYNPFQNEIVFPAGILQPPFFFKDGDDAVNYGAIGVVIGHEMTHGFDDQGRKFDANGNLSDWWTEEDAKRFNERAAILVEQFDSFEVISGQHANGKLTLGENIADLGGLAIAYDAFRIAQDRGSTTSAPGAFSPDQRFFLAYAHVWAQNIRELELQRRIKEDEHSPADLRVNVPLRNLLSFQQAFRVKPGDPMFLPADKQARIW